MGAGHLRPCLGILSCCQWPRCTRSSPAPPSSPPTAPVVTARMAVVGSTHRTSPLPPKFSTSWIASWPRIIRYGISGAGMPAFSSLKQQEVADVVAYLRILQGRGDIVKLPGDPKQGEALFFGKAQCSDCHMVNGKGGFIGSELSFYGADAKPDQIRAIILDPG